MYKREEVARMITLTKGSLRKLIRETLKRESLDFYDRIEAGEKRKAELMQELEVLKQRTYSFMKLVQSKFKSPTYIIPGFSLPAYGPYDDRFNIHVSELDEYIEDVAPDEDFDLSWIYPHIYFSLNESLEEKHLFDAVIYQGDIIIDSSTQETVFKLTDDIILRSKGNNLHPNLSDLFQDLLDFGRIDDSDLIMIEPDIY